MTSSVCVYMCVCVCGGGGGYQKVERWSENRLCLIAVVRDECVLYSPRCLQDSTHQSIPYFWPDNTRALSVYIYMSCIYIPILLLYPLARIKEDNYFIRSVLADIHTLVCMYIWHRVVVKRGPMDNTCLS